MNLQTFTEHFFGLDERGSALQYITHGPDDQDDEQVAELEARTEVIQAVNRVKNHVESCGVFSSTFKWVPSDYYDRPLEARAEILECETHQLTKAMVMENTAFSLAAGQTDESDPRNSRFYLVLVQYCAKLNAEKMAKVVHGLLPEAQRLGKKKSFNFRVANEDVGCALAGFRHNAVSPFGMVNPAKLPIIAAAAVFGSGKAPSPSFPIAWMGGGHPDLKLGCTPAHFVKALKPLVADISDPR